MSEHDDPAFSVALAQIDGDEKTTLAPDFHPSTLTNEEREFYDALRWNETTHGDLIVEPTFLRGRRARPGATIGLMEIQATTWGHVVLLRWQLRELGREMIRNFRPVFEPIMRLSRWRNDERT